MYDTGVAAKAAILAFGARNAAPLARVAAGMSAFDDKELDYLADPAMNARSVTPA
jgi:hypothetical protein